ncbi:unnamed protein product [Parnassius apollo]|uniref:(apollo) hypothetical protein n=1 Tax=Parnassius apollo TaxID=110799 RepID=A0A8S3WXS0_PARAO|nr:unnamed protein product [Parnassius apollo]
MAKQDDSLFLLEVLIDKIAFIKSPCFTDKDFRTCVNIECLSVEPFEICDDDPGSSATKSGGPFSKTFNIGKSCLFSLKEADIAKAMSKFPIKITVYKSLPCGCLPTKIVMGEATIDMTKEFVQARNKFIEDPSGVSYQALKDAFRIVGPDGAETGEIIMFLRISCFGKLIVTKFQGAGVSTKLETDRTAAPIDRSCHPQRDYQTVQDPCVCGATRYLVDASGTGKSIQPSCTASNVGGFGICPPARDPFNSMPCQESDDPCYCSGPKPTVKQNMICRNMDQYCLHVPKGRSKQFEEIGTNLGGNELKIKVPATSSIIKKISQTHCAMQSPYLKGTDDTSCLPPCGKNQISLAMPSEAICCNGAQLANTQFTCTTEGCIQASKHGQQTALARGDNKYQEIPNKDSFVLKVAKTAIEGEKKCKLEFELVTPKDCCPPGNKIIFQMPSDSCGTGHKQRAHFNYTTDGVGDIARDDPGQLSHTTSENYHGVVYDFPKQVIKLRIGKTIEMPGRKSKLEYQFVTPVVSHKKTVPVTDNRTAQYTSSCQGYSSEIKNLIPGTLLSLPRNEDNVEVNKNNITSDDIEPLILDLYKTDERFKAESETTSNYESSQCLTDSSNIDFSNELTKPITLTADLFSTSSVCTVSTIRSKRRSVSFSRTIDYFWSQTLKSSTNCLDTLSSEDDSRVFGNNETTVYMTLFGDRCNLQCSGTQATGSVNKCIQINRSKIFSPNYRASTNKYSPTKKLLCRDNVAKVGANGDRRCKLELELVTPKGPERKPLTRIDTRETQCDPDPEPCCCTKLNKKRN